MLIPAVLKLLLLFGGLAITLFGVLLFIARSEKAKREGQLPTAKLVGAKDRDWIRRLLPFTTCAFGLGLLFVMWFKTTDIIIVRDDGSSLSGTRRVQVFGSIDSPLAPGNEAYSSDPTWIINESSRAVQVKTHNYGRTLGFGSKPTLIPPHTAAAFHRIDHIGPSDPPPSTVMSSTKLGMEWRYWLTWD